MASQTASASRQRGASLIELMIASALSLLAIASVGSIYLSAQKSATQRSLDLLVLQSMSDTLKYIKEDALRAGYNGSNDKAAMVSGASSVFVTTSSSIGYVYLNKENKYEHVFFKHDDNNVKICSKQSAAISTQASCSPYFKMLDEKQVKVTAFEVGNTPLGSTVSSAFISIKMTGSLKNSTDTVTLSTSFKQRNWK
ncbi:putative Type 4 fimbrial biogenesis protein PilW [Vibrio nigripulchritudo SFn27]|uniref:Putative Type 4 fimbrial biogenesis protein PilW n=1 Tax=Vibrio nigripulchritudo TaxID=28173 RepID=U4K2E0_9VIBR|nr:type 4 fimbrial biogenesis protein PilW [Vibrio nigripulchritudo]CCN81878.1 putative Type 4 fimbrial biogenesis protein PilW [Vibrio nigripulchritudo BLFn1]CCN88343.1 putative Type 4 fimbrial biogenesis protein PilW [Vibrio nigripulchritudo SFn27]CCN95334.1 putative Type 4 fimbrial biogenesis protein PilW [Vibrio nigripulchritudo ENn2]CCO41330.1 putative Type 4 fimbrial biogenesis protein PilW [Vibrio nigripulchritudo SFn135]CCO54031.1 putative Type 4 fimbrial biogenesis protein PilW [Vibri